MIFVYRAALSILFPKQSFFCGVWRSYLGEERLKIQNAHPRWHVSHHGSEIISLPWRYYLIQIVRCDGVFVRCRQDGPSAPYIVAP